MAAPTIAANVKKIRYLILQADNPGGLLLSKFSIFDVRFDFISLHFAATCSRWSGLRSLGACGNFRRPIERNGSVLMRLATRSRRARSRLSTLSPNGSNDAR